MTAGLITVEKMREGTANRDAWLDAVHEVLGRARVIRRTVMMPVHLADRDVARRRGENLARLHGAQCWWHQLVPSSSGKTSILEVWLFGEGR